jgi:hypothetical protein
MSSGKHNWTNIMESLKVFSAITLLLLYGIGNIPVELIHEFVHTHYTIVAHTIEQEKDPCHVSIYHANSDGSCDHETHLTKVEKCNLCHLLFHNDHVALSSSATQFTPSFFSNDERAIITFPREIVVQLPSRAPPLISSSAS